MAWSWWVHIKDSIFIKKNINFEKITSNLLPYIKKNIKSIVWLELHKDYLFNYRIMSLRKIASFLFSAKLFSISGYFLFFAKPFSISSYLIFWLAGEDIEVSIKKTKRNRKRLKFEFLLVRVRFNSIHFFVTQNKNQTNQSNPTKIKLLYQVISDFFFFLQKYIFCPYILGLLSI